METSVALGRGWGRARAWLAMALLAVAADAAALGSVDPGEMPALGPDEGLLVVAFDTDAPVNAARFERRGSTLTAGVLNHMKQGRTLELYVVAAGRYHWSTITFSDTWRLRTYFDLADDPEFGFEVKPGQITYAGDLVFRAKPGLHALIHVANRSLPVIDWLQEQHRALYERYPFSYSGYYPDPFPAFYKQALAAAGSLPADLNSGREPPPAGPMPLSPAVMWARPRVRDVSLSPDGALVVEEVLNGDDASALDLVDVAAGTSQRIATSAVGFGTVRWESDRILLAGKPTPSGEALHVFRIGEAGDGGRRVIHLTGPIGGAIVDLLPDTPGNVLYEARDSGGRMVVHELHLQDQESIEGFRRSKSRDRLNVGVENDTGWFADGHGRLRAALATSGDDSVLMYGGDGRFREVLRYTGEDGFRPLLLSYDGDLIYGLSDEGRDQRDLVVFDPAQGKVTRTIYSKPGTDIEVPLFDDRRKPIGASYYQDGRLVSDYFGEQDQRLQRSLRAAFPGRTVFPAERSHDGRKLLLWVDGSDQPPQLYYLDADRKQAQLLDEYLPQLSGKRFVAATVIKARGADGLPIEGFLTLPPATGKRPLVVMPHGGPIGVADVLHFDRDVQFLASLGYAVLQVNFRGSEGYGRAFREAGRGQLGTGIEDDVDAVLQAALAQYPLDAGRMCVLGGSYGGYSALVSAIRWPDRFRCAVSISGVTDRALFFTASDGGRSEKGRADLERWLGDPRKDLDAMVASSPLYQYRKLKVPVMLVHGRDDLRVDFEHTRRLVRMLNIDHRPPVLRAFIDEGHGFTEPGDLVIEWTGIAGFLREHLGSHPAATTQVPADGAAGR